MTTALLVFLATAAGIVGAGAVLTRAADAIGEQTGLGRAWVGLILLATATSLPELATDVAAVRLGAADLAAGDLFGSTMANMLILACLGFLTPRNQIFKRTTTDQVLAASLAIILNLLAAAFILSPTGLAVRGVGPEPFVLVAVFVAGTLVIYRQDRHAALQAGSDPANPPPHRSPLRPAVVRFVLAAAVILAIAPIFAHAAQRIAELSGLGETFVGTLLVGLSTSLPEVVTSITAIRLGAFDLAAGNLFGSCAFNMAVFLPMELAHPGGPLFPTLDPGHAITAVFATVLMAIGQAAIVFRAERRHALIEPGSVLMILAYLAGVAALFAQARR